MFSVYIGKVYTKENISEFAVDVTKYLQREKASKSDLKVKLKINNRKEKRYQCTTPGCSFCITCRMSQSSKSWKIIQGKTLKFNLSHSKRCEKESKTQVSTGKRKRRCTKAEIAVIEASLKEAISEKKSFNTGDTAVKEILQSGNGIQVSATTALRLRKKLKEVSTLNGTSEPENVVVAATTTTTTTTTTKVIQKPRVEILYCTKCKWLLRASWMATELLQTFENDIKTVALTPSVPGTYVIQVYTAGSNHPVIIWDRKTHNGFPYPKEIKKIIRDTCFPQKKLGKCLEKK